MKITNMQQAAEFIAPLIGGSADKPRGWEWESRITIGEDSIVILRHTGKYGSSAIRATVEPGGHRYSSHKSWTSIKAQEDSSGSSWRRVVMSLDADLEKLTGKIKPLVAVYSGSHVGELERARSAEEKAQAQLAMRKPIAKRMVASGLAVYRHTWDKDTFTIGSTDSSPVEFRGMDEYVKISANVPYGKAEEVIMALKEILGT